MEEENNVELDSTKKVKDGILFTTKADGQVPYVVILKRIKDKEMNPDDYIFIDEKHNSWIWNEEIAGFECAPYDEYYFGDFATKEYITDVYNDLELIDVYLTPIPKKEEKNTPNILATKEVISEIEKMYMDLDMEIDSCQGCMDGIDIAFEKLKIYKDIVKYLGGDIDAHLQELTDEWWKKANEKSAQEKQDKEKEDAVIKKLPFPILSMVTLENESLRKYLWESNEKINEICDVLIRKLK